MTTEDRARSLVQDLMKPTFVPASDVLVQAIRDAEERGRVEAYEKARELVGFSPNACHAIEAQMQEEFPDRAFVPSTQMRAGSRMDGSNMRMPNTPNQLREEGRMEMRERCARVADAEWQRQDNICYDSPASKDACSDIAEGIRALPTTAEVSVSTSLSIVDTDA